jgi:hypothetical protein
MTKLGGKLYLIEYKNHKIDQMAQMVNPYTPTYLKILPNRQNESHSYNTRNAHSLYKNSITNVYSNDFLSSVVR